MTANLVKNNYHGLIRFATPQKIYLMILSKLLDNFKRFESLECHTFIKTFRLRRMFSSQQEAGYDFQSQHVERLHYREQNFP